MEKNKLNLKILTSIFIVLFFIVFFNSSSYAVTVEDSLQPIINYLDNDSTFQDTLNNYSYCLLMCTNNNYFYNNSYWVFMTNTSPLNFTGTDSGSSFNVSSSTNEDLYKLSLTYYRQGTISSTGYSSGSGAFGFNYTGDFNSYVQSITYIYKGNLGLSFNGSSVIEPVSEYDFSFIINNHNFDFTFEGQTFSNGITIDSDTIKEGHYVCSLYQFEERSYYNSSYKNYWVSGFIDYFPYSASDPEKFFYQPTGYTILRIRNSSEDNDYFYRFYFKGYSSDSSYQDFTNNIITNNVNDYNSYNNYIPFRSSTFFYSNRDIYWAYDTSLYGYSGLTTNLFYEEDSSGVSVNNVSNVEISSDDPEDDSTTYAIGNNVYNVPSTNASITSDSLYNYNGSSYGPVSTYEKEQNIFGTEIVKEDTSNWTTLDYIKHIPQAIMNVPIAIERLLIGLIIPSGDDLTALYNGFQSFAYEHLGVLNAPIAWIFDFMGSIQNKYNENYSYYPFTIPRF